MSSVMILLFSVILVTLLGIQSLSLNRNLKWVASINSFMVNLSQLLILKTMPGPTSKLDIACYLIGGPIGVNLAMWVFPKVQKILNNSKV